ncbi:hypothetical protein BDV96DRAFT_186163 [Lophiotrema nucula]|uniref:Uncharacterized protein n=1 Tax=Lophiotrema nucula TaxID=690887 RepID=A0A6A5YW95_9PLEO|nr:hypothetical protein BDV96DRAFT_186163 [Lophiotrema nucula]
MRWNPEQSGSKKCGGGDMGVRLRALSKAVYNTPIDPRACLSWVPALHTAYIKRYPSSRTFALSHHLAIPHLPSQRLYPISRPRRPGLKIRLRVPRRDCAYGSTHYRYTDPHNPSTVSQRSLNDRFMWCTDGCARGRDGVAPCIERSVGR